MSTASRTIRTVTQTNSVSGTTIEGTLESKPDQSYDIDLYKAICPGFQDHPWNRGIETYLGSVTVQTDDAGSADIVAELPLMAYSPITATATGPEGSSMLSPCLGARLRHTGDENNRGVTAQVGDDFTYTLEVGNTRTVVAPGSASIPPPAGSPCPLDYDATRHL